MKIPKRFRLYGHEINVEWDDKLLHKDDARGMARYRENKVVLQPSTDGQPQMQSQMEQAFCHELTHFLFHMAGYDSDRDDEAKVERVSNLLHQALTTMEQEA